MIGNTLLGEGTVIINNAFIYTIKTIFKNKAHELVYNMVQKVGSYEQLKAKKDVIYTYTYTTPDSRVDISTEKYLFEDETKVISFMRRYYFTSNNLCIF